MDEGLAGVKLDGWRDRPLDTDTDTQLFVDAIGTCLLPYRQLEPLLLSNMTLRVFSDDASTLAMALEELYSGCYFEVVGTSLHIGAGLLVCALFGVQGVRHVDLEAAEYTPTPYPEPIAARMRHNDFVDMFAPAPLSAPLILSSDGLSDMAVDVELFSNLALLHCGEFWDGNYCPALHLSGKLKDMARDGVVGFGLNIVQSRPVCRKRVPEDVVRRPILNTGVAETCIVLDSKIPIDTHFAFVYDRNLEEENDDPVLLIGIAITLCAVDVDIDAPLPVLTGITLQQGSAPLLWRDVDTHGKAIDGTVCTSYVFSMADSVVFDPHVLFNDWFIERRGWPLPRDQSPSIQLHAVPDDVPVKVTLVPIHAAHAKFSKLRGRAEYT